MEPTLCGQPVQVLLYSLFLLYILINVTALFIGLEYVSVIGLFADVVNIYTLMKNKYSYVYFGFAQFIILELTNIIYILYVCVRVTAQNEVYDAGIHAMMICVGVMILIYLAAASLEIRYLGYLKNHGFSSNVNK